MRSIHDPRYQAFINNLVELRVSKKVTQVRLAENLGRLQSYVSRIENKERRLDIIELVDWLKGLGVDTVILVELLDECAKL